MAVKKEKKNKQNLFVRAKYFDTIVLPICPTVVVIRIIVWPDAYIKLTVHAKIFKFKKKVKKKVLKIK